MSIRCRRNFKKDSFDWKLKGPFLTVKSNWRATSFSNPPPPPTPINSQNTPNQDFEIIVLFSVVERSGDIISLRIIHTHPSRALSARVISFAPRAYKVLWKGWSHKLRKGSLDWKSDIIVPFLKVKVTWSSRPLPLHRFFNKCIQ